MEKSQGSLWLIAVAVVLMLVFQVYTGMMGSSSVAAEALDESATQAVFLTNGQVYFGDVAAMDDESMVLENVYYLQVEQTLQGEGEDAETESSLALVKLGQGELHKPQDTMVVPQEQVLFWENLEADSEVVQLIESDASNPSELDAVDSADEDAQ